MLKSAPKSITGLKNDTAETATVALARGQGLLDNSTGREEIDSVLRLFARYSGFNVTLGNIVGEDVDDVRAAILGAVLEGVGELVKVRSTVQGEVKSEEGEIYLTLSPGSSQFTMNKNDKNREWNRRVRAGYVSTVVGSQVTRGLPDTTCEIYVADPGTEGEFLRIAFVALAKALWKLRG